MLKYMLDTNIVIYIIKRRPIEILDTFNRHAGQLCISSITLAELFHGIEKSSQVKNKYGYAEWHFIEIANDIRNIKNELIDKVKSLLN